ncbi:hypothetical protein PISMIDRAFT_686656 [Pisolithus microcarpus 441]|uniref:Uncharacterized protein n=1 Tax=Pisolithus microcarpus 441 TaxID=765257 RepID=A0A0C9Z1F3_9AGAM|nr:hypothetical protein PISMIDRAFT_686656 [Pisolithus microcarpus 441]
MALAKLKAVFTKKKSAANPGTDGPVPSATGEHGIQPSQNITGTADSARSTRAPEAQGRVEVSHWHSSIRLSERLTYPIASEGWRRRRACPCEWKVSQIASGYEETAVALAGSSMTLETKASDRPSGEGRARDSLSIRTVPRGDTPPSAEEEHSLEGESMRVLDGHSVYEERVINPGFSVLRAKDKYGRFLRIN